MTFRTLKARGLLLVLLVAGLSACATPIRSSVDVAENAQLDELKTYAWITEQPLLSGNTESPTVVNPINEQRIRTAVETTLASKCFEKVAPNDADFVVGFTLGSNDRLRVQQRYNNFGYGYYGFHSGFGRFGPRFGSRFGGLGSQVSVRTISEGTLIVDIFENTDKQAIWHGSATKSLSRDKTGSQLIHEAVSVLLDEFPNREEMARMMKTTMKG